MVLHRMFVLKALDELLAPVTGDELLDTVLPLLAQLADDEERVVRVALAERARPAVTPRTEPHVAAPAGARIPAGCSS